MAVTLSMTTTSTDASGKGAGVVEAYVYSITETSGSSSTQSRTVSVTMYAKRIDYDGTLSGCTCTGSSSLGNFSNNIESYTISYLGSKLCSFTLTVNADANGQATLGSNYYINVGTYASSGTAYRAIKVTFNSLSGLTPYVPKYWVDYYKPDGSYYDYYQYTAGNTFTVLSSGPSKNSTSLQDSTYKITGDGNGGYFGNSNTLTTSITATKSGVTEYTFSSWNTSSSGNGTTYKPGKQYTMPSYDLSLYPVYTTKNKYSYSNHYISALTKPSKNPTYPNTYTVQYNPLGGIVDKTNESVSTTRNWIFSGWADSKSATSANAATYYESATTVYAYWTYTDIKGKATLPTPKKIGYKFLGWGTSENQTSGLLAAGATPEISSDIVYYAIWKADGSIRIYTDDTKKYQIAMVWMYYPTSSTDSKPWKLVIPYIKTSSNWKITAG